VTTVSGQGQLNKGSTVFQGGSKGASGKGKYIESGSVDLSGSKGQLGGVDLSKAKDVTFTTTNSGISPDLLTTLLGSLPAAAPVIVNTPASSTPTPAPVTDQAATDTSAVTSITDWVKGLGTTGIVIAAVVVFLIFKKR
jgi:hypothetical protein